MRVHQQNKLSEEASSVIRVGTLTSSLSRHAGGLFWSVRCLSQALNTAGMDVTVFGANDDSTLDDAASWHPVATHAPSPIGPRTFTYMPTLLRSMQELNLNIVHTHGLWRYTSIAASTWARRNAAPYVMSLRGTLDPWALQNSGWKKFVARKLYQNRCLRNASCLHALCDSEYHAIRDYGLRNPVALIPNGVILAERVRTPSPLLPAQTAWRKGRVLLFLGRLHSKKGIAALIAGWRIAKQRGLDINSPWHLVIAGWDQKGHRQQLEQLADGAGVSGSIHFVGPQFGDAKVALLQSSSAFVLPSLSEGLPMAVLEAWAYGLPVLMTPQCNIPAGFDSHAAIKIEPHPDSIAEGLTRLFSASDEDLRSMGQSGRQLVERQFTWPKVASEMKKVYQWLLGDAPRPDCVLLD